MNQLNFTIRDGDFSDDFAEEAYNQTVMAVLNTYLHQPGSVAWIFDDRLRTHKATDEADENSHYRFFGTDAINARFRGWFTPAKQLTTVCDRLGLTREADEIPERLYRALRSHFNPQFFHVL